MPSLLWTGKARERVKAEASSSGGKVEEALGQQIRLVQVRRRTVMRMVLPAVPKGAVGRRNDGNVCGQQSSEALLFWGLHQEPLVGSVVDFSYFARSCLWRSS